MKKINEIHGNFAKGNALRWGMILLAAAIAAVLAGSLETGRVHAQVGSSFMFSEARVRVITPNGDSKNDVAILCYDNPKASGVRAEIFTLRGRKISEMTFVGNGTPLANNCPVIPGPASNTEALTWDGKAFGASVRSGIYIYVLKSEDKVVTGTILVVR